MRLIKSTMSYTEQQFAWATQEAAKLGMGRYEFLRRIIDAARETQERTGRIPGFPGAPDAAQGDPPVPRLIEPGAGIGG
jgi:hypothetical protein